MPGPTTRFVPREVCVFPRNPADSRAIALEMRSHGLLILARAPISGMILAATPVEGTEWITCQWLKTWAGVRGAELNVLGESFQPQAACPINPPNVVPCYQADPSPYPPLQLLADCPSPPAGQPNDEAFCFQWSLLNTGQSIVDRTSASHLPNSNGQCWNQTGVPGIDINLLEAWNYTTGSPLVTVAVLDTGVEYCNPDFDPDRFLYPDLALTCVGSEDLFAYPCCPPPNASEDVPCQWGPAKDNLGHGTIVAGIIGAVADNEIGIAGIDQRCRILSARVFGYAGSGQFLANSPSVNAARMAIALETIAILPAYRSVRVINISSGITESLIPAATLENLETTIDLLASQNRFIVAAAGNGGAGTADTNFPQNHPSVICVGAIDSRGWRMASPFAPSGPLGNFTSATGAALDFMAPGMAEVSLVCQSNPCPACPYPTTACESLPYHNNFTQGTSWAAPKVAAAVSLILAEASNLGVVDPNPASNPETWPGLTFTQMYDLLKAGARDQISHVVPGQGDPLDTPNPPLGPYDQYYGWGLIDIGASLCALRTLASQPCL